VEKFGLFFVILKLLQVDEIIDGRKSLQSGHPDSMHLRIGFFRLMYLKLAKCSVEEIKTHNISEQKNILIN
jgi:hypothetical protein